ncbi:MAG: uroporphyrinogen decarboxylase family protein [Verrucomicrobiia bacterium]
MTEQQWQTLLAVIHGEPLRPLPTGFIIDSPWLPNWAGHTILDYFTSEQIWMDAHWKAIRTFPQTIFLPGFWSEYGMCTEPSAFGAVSMFAENEFPFARKLLRSADDVDFIEKPNPQTDGLLPFVIKRLKHLQPEIEKTGRKIRFAVARGPLNIASFLMGTTEFLMALKTDSERMHRLLTIITDYLVEWIAYQRECFPSIDGILLLDDIVGFIGKNDFETFGLPYLKKAYDTSVAVKFFHNDAPCKVCAPYLPEVGINLLNFGVQHTINEMKAWTGNKITLLGNIPPRDVLAQGTPDDVKRAVTDLVHGLQDRSRLILSCGGGMPPGAPTENIQTFITTVGELTA